MLKIERQAHGQQPVGGHGGGQPPRRPARQALLEMDEQRIVGDDLEALLGLEVQPVVERGSSCRAAARAWRGMADLPSGELPISEE